MSKIKLIVFNEHTLGYIIPQMPKYCLILHASILKGAPFETHATSKYIGVNDKVRLASKDDFDSFRVRSDGFLDNPQEYEFKKV